MNALNFHNDNILGLYSCFDESILKKLSEYNIFTIGQLLSATKGFSNSIESIFGDTENKIIEEIKAFIPTQVIEDHKSFTIQHPTGLIIDKKNRS